MEPSRNVSWWRRHGRAAFGLDVRSLAVYRMALGAILCLDCLQRAGDFDLMFAVDGIFPPAAVRRALADPAAWSLAFLHDASWWNAAVLALQGVAGLLLAIGAGTRWATVAAWVAVVSVIRRTFPAANSGDAWLACQLFWSMFIPLGARWSLDARRAARTEHPVAYCSAATAALVLQLVCVYVSAGIAKCNASWTGGEPLVHALSVHDHGTWLGAMLARSGLARGPLGWSVIAFEVAAPLLLLLWPTPRVRLATVAAFAVFHASIWMLLSVGLFVPIALAAWLPLLPASVWRQREVSAERIASGLSRPAGWVCGAGLALAAVSALHARCMRGALPRPVNAALAVTALGQDWSMFGHVPAMEQWVVARGVNARGVAIDLLRGGRVCGGEPPAGGFTSLRDHRWHRLCWVLGTPAIRGLAPDVAAGLARHWNATHAPAERVTSVEIRHAMRDAAGNDGGEFESLVAAWPPRDAAGGGSLDRLLEATAREDAAEP